MKTNKIGTCNNCKHIRYPRDKTYEGNGKCMKGHAEAMLGYSFNGRYVEHMIVTSNFGCIDFEKGKGVNKWQYRKKT